MKYQEEKFIKFKNHKMSKFALGLERALLEYEIIMNPNVTGEQRQRATVIDAQELAADPSRMFKIGKTFGVAYKCYVDERYLSKRKQYHQEQSKRIALI